MAKRGKKPDLSDFFDKKAKEQLKKEIKEELKKELRGEGINIEFISGESENEKTIAKEDIIKPIKKKKNPYVQTLVFLVIIILLVDLFSVYFYYKPNLNLNFINPIKSRFTESSISLQKCEDGTPYNQCAKEKPYYCYEGNLLKKAFTCGCPSGYKVDFQDCVKT
ncbi:MAG: hypothetical protein AABX54_01725 [Nanoarchaeota archaeon]